MTAGLSVVLDVRRLGEGSPRAAANVGTLTFDGYGVVFRPQHGDPFGARWEQARVTFDAKGAGVAAGERFRGFFLMGLVSFLPGVQKASYMVAVSTGASDVLFEVDAGKLDNVLTAQRIVEAVPTAGGRVSVGAQVLSATGSTDPAAGPATTI